MTVTKWNAEKHKRAITREPSKAARTRVDTLTRVGVAHKIATSKPARWDIDAPTAKLASQKMLASDLDRAHAATT